MKKTIMFIAALAIIPAMIFAQLGVGGAAMLRSPTLTGQPVKQEYLNVNQFSFGGDVRLKSGWLQFQSLLFSSSGDVTALDTYLDVGVALDYDMLRLSAGIGPNLTWNFGEDPLIQTGMNAKIGVDFMMGNLSVGASYLMAMKWNDRISVNTGAGLLGFSVVFWM